ncbi:MAG: RNA-binding S4 domain-containing protein [Alphaproteobacteria bacterium]|nr:RNA-binding S4 domain-containing protein [Alphaproteobacteria bacterium]MDX5369772.1 RNA-binding S4 domain-containing protein [Alphaproteobacteria bacterium]MDX5464396.1 RNA-binding S4 domain-containing protein [Alphaproteobacteria bacterium]
MPLTGDATESPRDEAQRIDRWLWCARFFKSRTLAGKAVASGPFRLNGTPVSKPSVLVKPGDTLTFTLGDRVRVVRVVAPGLRRGPAPEARTLYEDLSPPPPAREGGPGPAPDGAREPGAGRPTKRDRRATDRLKGLD